MKSEIRKIFFNTIPVIIGILLALFIDDYRQAQSDQQFVSQTLEAIATDFETNIQNLEEVVVRQVSLLDTLEKYQDDPELSLMETIFQAGGLKVETIRNVIWKSFISRNFNVIEYELIARLTDIEEFKEIKHKMEERILSFVYENGKSKKLKDKQLFTWIIQDLIGVEEQLITEQKAFIKAIGK
jgi:hypothetical protein